MDILVGFDTSNQINTNDFDKIKKFLRNMVNNYEVSKDKVRIGLINFGSNQKVVLQLNEGNTEKRVVSAIQKITKIGRFDHIN